MATLPASADFAAGIRPTALAWRSLLYPILPLAGPAFLIGAWALASSFGAVPEEILPSPSTVLATARDLFGTGELLDHLSSSLVRLIEGYLIGASIGLVLGAAMGASTTAEELLYPSVRAIAQVPFMAWLPLFILLVGIGEPLKLIAVGKAAAIPIALATSGAVRSLPPAWREVADSLCLSRRTRWCQVVLPAIAPPLVTGLRQGLGNAWVALVGAELLASTSGIGYLMNWGRVIFQLDIVLVGIIVVGLTGLVLDRSLRFAEARLAGRMGLAR